MKTHRSTPARLGLMLALSLTALPVVSLAQSPSTAPDASAQVVPDNRLTQNVSGKVTAKTDTTLTVGARTVTLNSATTYSKGGAAMGSGDIKVGDSVNIVTTADGQVAVSVTVTASG